ncbi:MAG TPA: hypothetical protein LFW20_07120 [Rickettsia endosymbiont of Omalisus fontisbellaquei]|jgi:hypothetical protein|nr:hypothetical protein [Rickettsia endosymbiont of Omalisus fontisbellaquei]
MAIVDGFLTSPTTKVKLRWLKLEQFKFNQLGVSICSTKIPKTLPELVAEFTSKENLEILKVEIAELLERPLKKRDIDAIEKRLAKLEAIFGIAKV